MLEVIGIPLLQVLLTALALLRWVLFAYVIISWLVFFGVINSHNQFIANVYLFLQRLIEPMLRPFRRYIPNMGGLDLSFLALIFILYFVELVVGQMLLKLSL